MSAVIMVPETRLLTSNANACLLAQKITARGIAFDMGGCDALLIVLETGQRFLLKNGYSVMNNQSMNITQIFTVTYAPLTGVQTLAPSVAIVITFGDCLPTLGPQNLQFSGLGVTVNRPLPTATMDVNADDTTLSPGTVMPFALLSGGAVKALGTTWMVTTALGLTTARGSVEGVAGMVPKLGNLGVSVFFSNAAAGGASVIKMICSGMSTQSSLAFTTTFSALPAVAGSYILIVGWNATTGTMTASIYTNSSGSAVLPALQSVTFPLGVPIEDFNMSLQVLSGDDLSLLDWGMSAQLG